MGCSNTKSAQTGTQSPKPQQNGGGQETEQTPAPEQQNTSTEQKTTEQKTEEQTGD